MNITRREFLVGAGAGLLTPFLAVSSSEAATTGPFAIRRFLPSTLAFPISVASGDPTPTGVILWTRLSERIWRADRTLAFQVSRDPSFRRIVFQGLVDGSVIGPASDFTVKVDLDGNLQPGGVYYYRFIYNGIASRTGRCRTLPPPGAPIEKVKFGVVTCQDYLNGYYGAFAHIAKDSSIDFVVHLGDFIYESGGGSAYPGRRVDLPSGQSRASTLDDFRTLYRTYRSDPLHQLAMEYHTWIVIWDDHETANDCFWDYENDSLGAPNHPFRDDPVRLRQLKFDAQRAWSEYVPARPAFNPLAAHPHDALSIFRRFQFGNLVDLVMTDERTYRTPHPCGEGGEAGRLFTRDCDERRSPAASMLGGAQRNWFVDNMTASTALWKVWGNEVFVGALTVGPAGSNQIIANVDAWDGFYAERDYILQTLRNAGLNNLVVLTGDLHTYIASYVKIDYGDRDNTNPANVVGVELMTPAVTSSNIAQQIGVRDPPENFLVDAVRGLNPHIAFFNGQDWGYSTVEFKRTHCEYVAYRVDKSVNTFKARRDVLRRLAVPVNTVRMVDT